jgi:hypothetical protein
LKAAGNAVNIQNFSREVQPWAEAAFQGFEVHLL